MFPDKPNSEPYLSDIPIYRKTEEAFQDLSGTSSNSLQVSCLDNGIQPHHLRVRGMPHDVVRVPQQHARQERKTRCAMPIC